jgi:hypothetical protein
VVIYNVKNEKLHKIIFLQIILDQVCFEQVLLLVSKDFNSDGKVTIDVESKLGDMLFDRISADLSIDSFFLIILEFGEVAVVITKDLLL